MKTTNLMIAALFFLIGCGPDSFKVPDGKPCRTNDQCISGLCAIYTNGICVPQTCRNNAQDGLETDEDCGGNCNKPCDTGKRCSFAQDCEGGVCFQTLCYQASCGNNLRDGAESDTDCGGATCPPCVDDRNCGANADCQSACCRDGRINTCVPIGTDPGVCLP